MGKLHPPKAENCGSWRDVSKLRGMRRVRAVAVTSGSCHEGRQPSGREQKAHLWSLQREPGPADPRPSDSRPPELRGPASVRLSRPHGAHLRRCHPAGGLPGGNERRLGKRGRWPPWPVKQREGWLPRAVAGHFPDTTPFLCVPLVPSFVWCLGPSVQAGHGPQGAGTGRAALGLLSCPSSRTGDAGALALKGFRRGSGSQLSQAARMTTCQVVLTLPALVRGPRSWWFHLGKRQPASGGQEPSSPPCPSREGAS